jgi:hypothetical protein
MYINWVGWYRGSPKLRGCPTTCYARMDIYDRISASCRGGHFRKGVEMSLRITHVRENGDIEKERVVMRAESDTDVGSYIMLNCDRISEEQVESGDIPSSYWFEDKAIKKGDFVVLYTKAGQSSEKTNESGFTSHFFYWNRSTTMWSMERRAVLVKVGAYQFSP